MEVYCSTVATVAEATDGSGILQVVERMGPDEDGVCGAA